MLTILVFCLFVFALPTGEEIMCKCTYAYIPMLFLNIKIIMELQKKFTFTRGHFFIAFREKGRETDRERETPIGFSLIYASNGDQICNLGKCPDQESNPQTFGLQDDTPAN